MKNLKQKFEQKIDVSRVRVKELVSEYGDKIVGVILISSTYFKKKIFFSIGEMELTSAVRSVSYKSDMNKCNGNLTKSNDSEKHPSVGNKVYIH